MTTERDISSDIVQKKRPVFIDVFAGCGGLSLGLLKSGWQGLFAIESDSLAFSTLNHNLINSNKSIKFDWPAWLPVKNHEIGSFLEEYSADLASLKGSIDMLVGGPPCQGFSSAGRRDPKDPRNKLVEQYLELVKIIQPSIVLVENVRGIASDFNDTEAPDGKFNYAKWLEKSLQEEHYVYTQLIDTSEFGVPQKRYRYFIIAIRKDSKLSCKESPFDTLNQIKKEFIKYLDISSIPVSSKSAISDLEVARNGTQQSQDSDGFLEIKYQLPLTSYQRLMQREHSGRLSDTRLANHKEKIVDRFEKIIEACHSNGRLGTSLSKEMKEKFGLKKAAIRVIDPDTPSPTITSMPDDLLHYSEPRTLTVRENARLQSFPDWFEFQGKYTSGGDRRRREVPRFTQVANAVPPLIAEAIGLSTLAILNRQQSKVMEPDLSKSHQIPHDDSELAI